MGMGVAGSIITSDYGSFPYSLLSTSKSKSNAYLVGGSEPWNFMIFHSVGNVIIPTDFNSIIFQGGRSTTNQIYVILISLIIDYHRFTIDQPPTNFFSHCSAHCSKVLDLWTLLDCIDSDLFLRAEAPASYHHAVALKTVITASPSENLNLKWYCQKYILYMYIYMIFFHLSYRS